MPPQPQPLLTIESQSLLGSTTTTTIPSVTSPKVSTLPSNIHSVKISFQSILSNPNRGWSIMLPSLLSSLFDSSKVHHLTIDATVPPIGNDFTLLDMLQIISQIFASTPEKENRLRWLETVKLVSFPQIRSAEEGTTVTPRQFTALTSTVRGLANCSSLKSLQISTLYPNLSADLLYTLQRLPHLEELRLQGCADAMTKEVSEVINGLEKLTVLDITAPSGERFFVDKAKSSSGWSVNWLTVIQCVSGVLAGGGIVALGILVTRR